MAGINNLKEIYEKKGEAFLTGLLNKYVIVNEKVDGAFFGVKKTADDSFKYFKKSGEITYVDRVLMKYYNPAIRHFEELEEAKRQRIPSNFFFGFEFFTRGDSMISRKVGAPKNGLVLCYIHRLDDSGNVVETLQSKDQLTRWANYLEVDVQPIIFEGHLDDEQKTKILEFVYSDSRDLEEKFKTKSFTKHILSVLDPDSLVELNDRELETLVFRFYGDSSENEDVFLAKMVDPMFQKKLGAPDQKKSTSSQDYIWLIVIDLMNHFEMYDIDEVRNKVSDSETYEEKYIKLINSIFKDFLKDYSEKYEGLVLEIPEYLKRPEFELDVDMVGDPDVVNLISKSETNKEIYKILLNFFRKVRKKSNAGFFTPELVSQLNLIVQKIKNIIMGDAVYEGLFPSFSQFLGTPNDFSAMSEKEFAEAASQKVEPTQVNIIIGAFQPVTMGHIKSAELMKQKNGKKSVLVAIKGENPTKMSPFTLSTTRMMLNKVQQEHSNVVADIKIVPNGSMEEIIKALRPDYEPILWGTTSRRLKDYAIQLDYIKRRDIPLRISKDFKIDLLPSYVKSEEVLKSIKDSNFAEYKKLVPDSIESEFFNLQKELGVRTPIMESQDERLSEKDFNKDKTEEIA
jgi:hypothetical protein